MILIVIGFFLMLGGAIGDKPNIIVIIADDMGFNDVSFHGSDEIPTPNIDALAYNGVILNSHYTQALCTPSRASFLTGKYPIHLGMQHLVILEPEPWGLPLNETLMPQYLKKNGYVTRLVGKWHLGFAHKEYTPTYRGFDSHYGYWQGYQDYWNHSVHASYTTEMGYDFRRNMSVDWDAHGKYTTTLLTDEAVNLIQNHDVSNPLFMYLAHLAPHSGNDWEPLQAPDEEIAKFAHIEDPERRVYAAMVSLLDKSVGTVIQALRQRRMLDNTIIIFMSDNGAAPEGIHANHGSNYPFRGAKSSAWDGGMRNIAAVWSPLIKNPKRVSNNLMHISDWIPTLYSAAGLDKSQLPHNLDGVDQWEAIISSKPSPRTEILHNIDDIWNFGGIRQGDWKYIYGSSSKGRMDGWYGNNGKQPQYHYDPEMVLKSPVGFALNGLATFNQIKQKNHLQNHTMTLLNKQDILSLRTKATVTCPALRAEQQLETHKCLPMQSPCLFNIKEDPCEQVNLASEHPLILHNLEKALLGYKLTARKPINIPRDPRADPDLYNGTWTNWLDLDEVTSLESYNHLSSLTIGLISGACLAVIIIMAILLSLSCQKTKGSLRALYGDKNVEDRELKEKCTGFEERERQLMTSLKDEFREV